MPPSTRGSAARANRAFLAGPVRVGLGRDRRTVDLDLVAVGDLRREVGHVAVDRDLRGLVAVDLVAVTALADDLAMALAARSLRIEAPFGLEDVFAMRLRPNQDFAGALEAFCRERGAPAVGSYDMEDLAACARRRT